MYTLKRKIFCDCSFYTIYIGNSYFCIGRYNNIHDPMEWQLQKTCPEINAHKNQVTSTDCFPWITRIHMRAQLTDWSLPVSRIRPFAAGKAYSLNQPCHNSSSYIFAIKENKSRNKLNSFWIYFRKHSKSKPLSCSIFWIWLVDNVLQDVLMVNSN